MLPILRSHRWLLAGATFSLMIFPFLATAQNKPGSPADFEARIYTDVDGKTLSYRLLKPKNYGAAQRYPLVLFLHGAGERGSDNVAQLKHCVGLFTEAANREKFPCFVVAPQCPMTDDKKNEPWGWTGVHPFHVRPYRYPEKAGEPGRMAVELVAKLQQEFSVDADRLYVGGISMGGFGTWDALARHPAVFAAGVPVCGGGEPETAARFAKVPVWCFHGAMDPTVPAWFSRTMIDALKAAGGQPRYTEYPETKHDSWLPTFAEPELLPWLFAQKRTH